MLQPEIAFDEDDRNLFQVADLRLRADALRYSLLPRLRAVLREACVQVHRVFGIDVFEDSIESCYPHFRLRRLRELEFAYDHAFAGLGGKRTLGKWHGVARRDGKPVQIVPFRLGFGLAEDGVYLDLHNHWLKGLTAESSRRFLQFVLDHEDLVLRLCWETGMTPLVAYGEGVRPLSPLREHYRLMMEMGDYANNFVMDAVPFPLSARDLESLIHRYVLFFPIYDSYIQLAKGGAVRFTALVDRLNDWLEAEDGEEPMPEEVARPADGWALAAAAARAAEARVPVLPALRWQVFVRDGWKCVACGRSAHDGIVLQVDHIVPRSKGGVDRLENFQTLCHVCNGGKSNRSTDDLRRGP